MKAIVIGQVKILAILLILCACQPSTTRSFSSEVSSTTVVVITSTTSPPTTPENMTLTSVPSPPSPGETPIEHSLLTITILYNNIEYDPSLKTAWGFSALVEREGQTLLFDTGGDGAILMENMSTLDIDPTRIQGVILSHIHADHIGGLNALLNTGLQPPVYVPPSFPTDFKNALKQKTSLIEVAPGQPIVEGVLTTGELGTGIREQALIVRTNKGMVIITGCAHPGIIQMIEQAITMTGDPVYLVMGGFHLGDAGQSMITSILEEFRRMGVQKVAPTHCTGDQAIQVFREAYGPDFVESGAGSVLIIDP
jgi:7,8-dihydropterin-6-yl-methyl-4-(beta-D-ribofuranosyl)aminobenzene 5'-phosphate synthase